ncbi:MAG TPA: hypothetical protein VIV64_06550 [Gammaproteobacteria bacterium]|jgi:hypothetical protein
MPRDRWLILGAALLYASSLAMPAIEGSGFPALTGLDVLRQGAGAWRDGVVAWYANPLLIVALIAGWLRSYRFALAAVLAGLLLALSSFSAEWAAESGGRNVPAFSFAAGFYVWIGAYVLAAAGALLGYIRSDALARRKE